MALTRKMLAAMNIAAEAVDEIINAHTETVNALKEERDQYKADAEKLAQVQSDLATANTELESLKKEDWKAKYDTEHQAFENFKNEAAAKDAKATKEAAYKTALTEAGIPEKRHAAIIRVTDLSKVDVDKDGKLKDSKAVVESIKTEWAEFVTTEIVKGAKTATPPNNNGGDTFDKMSLADKMAYANEHPDSPEVLAWLK